MTAYVHFERPIPVGGTSVREEHFSEEEGWRIEIRGGEVVLSRPADGIRPATPAFRVVNVGFCAKDVPRTTLEDLVQADFPGLPPDHEDPPVGAHGFVTDPPIKTRTRKRPAKL